MNYQNPNTLQAVILDWAGTVVDFGSFAPTPIFCRGLAASSTCKSPSKKPVARWAWASGTISRAPLRPTASRRALSQGVRPHAHRRRRDRHLPALHAVADREDRRTLGADPRALDTIAQLREQGIKIGSCSGYPKQVMDKVVALAATNGYVADHVVATDEVPNGRPWPARGPGRT